MPSFNGFPLEFESKCFISVISEFMGKTFQAAQLTHERFLTVETLHLHTRGRRKFSLADIKKNILQECSTVKNLSCVSCAA